MDWSIFCPIYHCLLFNSEESLGDENGEFLEVQDPIIIEEVEDYLHSCLVLAMANAIFSYVLHGLEKFVLRNWVREKGDLSAVAHEAGSVTLRVRERR